MFQFSWCRFSCPISNFGQEITQYNLRWVASFGISRIKACLRLPETYRCLPRPSSPHLTKSSVHKPFVAWPKFWFSRFIIVVYPQDLKKTLLLDMSTSVKLIICRNSLLLTQQKLSKNIDLRDKAQNKCFILKNFSKALSSLLGLSPRYVRFSATKNLLVVNFWWSWAGSNRWPPACKAGALPAELQPLIIGGPEWIRTTDPSLIRAVL